MYKKTAVIAWACLDLLSLQSCGTTDSGESTDFVQTTIIESTDDSESMDFVQTTISESTMEIIGGVQETALDAAFAFANKQGNVLIITNTPNSNLDTDLTKYHYAIGKDGIIHETRYSKYQESTENDTDRDTMYNFENLAGHTYSIIGTDAIPNDTYILLRENFDAEYTLLERKDASSSWSQNVIKQCEEIADRKIANSWFQFEHENSVNVGMVEFEANGKDLLAWLLLEQNGKLNYFAFPTTLDEYGYSSGWDQGRLPENWTFIHTIFEKNDNIVVYLGWHIGEEAETIREIVFPKNGKILEKIVCNRYTSPW